jgi:hypothetical protein
MGENDCGCDSIFSHFNECKNLDKEKRKFAFLEVIYVSVTCFYFSVRGFCRTIYVPHLFFIYFSL